MVYTPRIYWLAVALGALIAALIGSMREYSTMSGAIKDPPAEVVKKAEELSGQSGAGDAIAKCQSIYDARAAAGAKDVGLPRGEECKPYRNYRDFRGPTSAVYGLYGSIFGLLFGMFVNKRLRLAGKLRSWTD